MGAATGATDESALQKRVAEIVRASLGRAVTAIEPLTGQLGLRRFWRVSLDGHPDRAIARIDAPEDAAGRPAGIPAEPALEPVRSLLESAGLPVPRRYGGEADGSIELLEDLGDVSLRDAVDDASPAARQVLYREACDLVPRLQALKDPGGLPAFSRRLDAPYFRYKADLFTRWSIPTRGRAATAAEAKAVTEAFDAVARQSLAAPARFSHRDFQSANLHLRAGDAREKHRLVMIDLQGALLAPPEYDLVCLLRDSYVELPGRELDDHRARIRAALPDAPSEDEFAARFDALTLTRKSKDHARFIYASAHRGDHRFLEFAPATLRYLQRAADDASSRDAVFAPLAAILRELPERPRPPEVSETPCAE